MDSQASMASKASLPPGSLVYVGRPEQEPTKITAVDYDPQTVHEYDQAGNDDLAGLLESPATTWVRVSGVHDVAAVEQVGKLFGLHPLTMEDIVNTGIRPKVEEYDHYLFFTLKALSFNQAQTALELSQISLVLGKSHVLEFRQGQGDPFRSVMDRIKAGRVRIRKKGADYLTYALIDVVVDSYFGLIDAISDELEGLEEDVLSRPGRTTLTKLHLLKRVATKLRHQVWPLREAVAPLARGDSELAGEDTAPYWRDLYDHLVQILDMVESLRENLSSLVDIYLNTTSHRMNEIMKVLTIIATIFIPLTFLAGVYGMNFKHMPELELKWAYPTLIGVMVVVALVMLVYFWRRKWLGRD